MGRFFTRKRILLYLTAVILAAGIWSVRWRLFTLSIQIRRMLKQPIAADEWWNKARKGDQFWKVLHQLAEVPPQSRGDLLQKSLELPPSQRVALLWFLLSEGHAPAAAALKSLVAETPRDELLEAMEPIDIFNVCASQMPLTPDDIRKKRAAAGLVLALGRKFDDSCGFTRSSTSSAPSTGTAVARAVLGQFPPPCQENLPAMLDDESLGAVTRREAYQVTGLLGRKGALELVSRLCGNRDPRVRAWAADGLRCGAAGEDRTAAATRLREVLESGAALEPRLARSVLASLTWTPGASVR